jgi:hypothetical protein
MKSIAVVLILLGIVLPARAAEPAFVKMRVRELFLWPVSGALGFQIKSIAVVLILLGIVLPAMGAEPAFARTCVKATQTERGRMTEITVAESSGFRNADAFARNLVKVFRLELKKSESVPRQEGFVVVDLFEDGSFASTLFKNKGRLVRACDDPTPLENGF